MTEKSKNTDLLNDGSFASYIMRFILSVIFGIFIDIVLLAASFLLLRGFFHFWYVYMAIPVICGVVGIFKFELIRDIYTSIHERYLNQ